ncbi:MULTISPECIES: hypothetical protein [Rhizobium]|uniref:hypothetical protein n=1 Tax=Rhizobium TaxID=379 RepID=UPI001931303C|nr:hypothetical protein [Rhizobium rosettiformans]
MDENQQSISDFLGEVAEEIDRKTEKRSKAEIALMSAYLGARRVLDSGQAKAAIDLAEASIACVSRRSSGRRHLKHSSYAQRPTPSEEPLTDQEPEVDPDLPPVRSLSKQELAEIYGVHQAAAGEGGQE